MLIELLNKAEMDPPKLHRAILEGNIDLVNDLLWNGHNPDESYVESSMNTPLLLAASLADIEMLRMLCNHGCNMNSRTIHGETALHLIISSKRNLDDGIKLLLDYGCDANIQENLYGQTPLHALVKHLIAIGDYTDNSMATLKYLIEKSDPFIGDHSNRTALHRACFAKAHIDCIQALLDCGTTNQNTRGENALHEALESDHNLDVITLLANNTDLKQITAFGETPLHIAARKGRSSVVQCLLSFGAPINAQDLNGNTPLHSAAERGYTNVVEVICSHPEIDLNIQNREGLTALHVAVESGFLPVVECIWCSGNINKFVHLVLTMFNQVIELAKASKSYFQNHRERRLVFDTSLMTSCLLFTLCAIVTSQQYFGNPIECMLDQQNDQTIPESVLNKFCFISVTYVSVDFKGPPEAGRKYSFYPWVPLVLLIQGLSFLLPHNFWSYIDDGFFENCLKDRNSLIIDNDKIQPLARYLALRMNSFLMWSLGYVLSEVIFVLNVVINFYFTDIFLGGAFLEYGLQVFFNAQSAAATSFPSMTRCIFQKFGPSGTIESRDALCVMTLNMLNEKFYLLLWFWFSFLLIVSAVIFLCRLCFLTIVCMGEKSSCLIKLTLTPMLGWNSMFVLLNKLTVSDWIFIQQLAKSMHPTSYSKLIENIVLEISEPNNMKLKFVDASIVYMKCERLPHSNSNI